MGDIAGLQRRVFPHSNKSKVTKVSEVFPVRSNLSVHSSAFWFGHSSSRVYQGSQGSETYGPSKGYQDPPVPRRLVVESRCPETCLQHTQTLLATVRVGGKHEKIRANTATSLKFRRLSVRPGFAHSRPMVDPPKEVGVHKKQEELYCQAVHVADRTAHSNRKAGMVRSSSHETHPMALETTLACPQSFGEGYSGSAVSPPPLRLVLEESNVLKGQPLHPLQHALQLFTDALNEGWGAHLGDSIARGVWSSIESRLHINFLELKAVLALKSFQHLCRDQIVLVATDNTTVVSYINKQGGMKSGSLCALLWRLLSWCHPRGIVLRARHIPGHLNVIADKLSQHKSFKQSGPYLNKCSIMFHMGPFTNSLSLCHQSWIRQPGR